MWLLLLLVVFLPLEKLFAVHPQKVFRKSFPVDLAYYFLNSLLPKMLLVVPMAFIAWGPEEIDWLVNPCASVRYRFRPPLRLCSHVCVRSGRTDEGTVSGHGAFALVVGTLRGFFVHANVRWRFGWLGLVVSTPAFHHWHHTNSEHANKNYASMLPFMDKLFGTWYMPKKQWPPKCGIDAPMAKGLAAQLLQPMLRQDEKALVPCAETAS